MTEPEQSVPRKYAECVDEVDIEECWNDIDTGQITTVVVSITRANGTVDRYTLITEPGE